jgi:hypothetical protein
MKRVHYFNGQLLSAADLQTEQDYHLSKQRRLNLRAPGPGVVSGLEVSIHPSCGEVHVRPGVAIDPRGNEIVVDTPQILSLPKDASEVCLILTSTETLTDLVPTTGDAQGETQPTRVEEGFKLEYARALRRREEEQGIAIARLTKIRGHWTLNPRSGSLWKVGVVLLIVASLCRRYSASRRHGDTNAIN